MLLNCCRKSRMEKKTTETRKIEEQYSTAGFIGLTIRDKEAEDQQTQSPKGDDIDSEEEEATEGAWREELDLSVAKNGDSEKDDVVLVECEKGLFLKV
ncbi:unnamed protein product [Sphagnum troendelagicum]